MELASIPVRVAWLVRHSPRLMIARCLRTPTGQAPYFVYLTMLLLGATLCLSLPARAEETENPARERPPTPAEAADSPALKPLPQRVGEAQKFYEQTVVSAETAPAHAGNAWVGMHQGLWLGALMLGVGGFMLRKLGAEFFQTLKTGLKPLPANLAAFIDRTQENLAEAESIATFAAIFRVGPDVSRSDGPTFEPAAAPGETWVPAKSPLEEFRAAAPDQLRELRDLVEKILPCSQESQLQPLLGNLNVALARLKGMAGLPELLPLWQLTYALECLVKQLIEKCNRATPAALQTVATAINLLEGLCRPGVRADLCTYPTMRLLAVDDDAISRHAIALSLKKALETPDLANDGESALALLEHHAYDVIFLDVEMPGMDGLELCARIRKTSLNGTVPVVFITSHGDPETRAKMASAGGTDLIVKPFLIFELAVKALTMVLHGRLQLEQSESPEFCVPRNFLESPASTVEKEPAAKMGGPEVVPSLGSQEPDRLTAKVMEVRSHREALAEVSAAIQPETKPGRISANEGGGPELETSPEEFAQAFRARASEHVAALEELLELLEGFPPGEARCNLVQDLQLGVRVFTPMAELASLEGPLETASIVEELLNELIAQPEDCPEEKLQAITLGLSSLKETCGAISEKT